MNLRSGRLKKEMSDEAAEYNSSLEFDEVIFEADIKCNTAHTLMLKNEGIIDAEIADKIVCSLDKLQEEGYGALVFDASVEDVHMAIENYVTNQIGPEAGFMHTAKSRNDQVATDLRLVLREKIIEVQIGILEFIEGIVELAIRTTIENTFFYHDDSKKHGNVLAVIFIILGILVLAFEYIALHYGWFGPETSLSKDIIDSLVSIIVWVFIWEGGAILFLSYDSESTLFHKDIRRFHGINFINELGDSICALKENTLYHRWVNPKKSERFAQNYILFSYPVLLAIATISIAEIIENGSYVSLVAMIPYILDAVLMLLLTICNISFYREQGVMKKLALPLSIVLDVIMALNIVSWFFDVIYWKFFIIDCFAFIMVLIEIICLIYIRKQNVNIDKNTENYLNENK